jgi:ABC-type multidrug transport system ATPase subunit
MTDYAIDVNGLAKSFGKVPVVQGLTLRVPQGEICGFLGGNGSGKTTTIRLLCGLLTPDAGQGTCLGLDITREARALRMQIGYMTQRFSYYADLTTAENLRFVARVYGIADPVGRANEIMQRMGLADRARQPAGELSGGWKQRLALAAAVMHAPRLLLLDEPTAGVDAKARRDFWDVIVDMAAGGMTVLMSTHYMDEAERCQRLVYLSSGRIVVSGTSEEVIAAAHLTAYDGTGTAIDAALRRLRGDARVGSAGLFGRVLHVAGDDRAGIETAMHGMQDLDVRWQEVAPRLDDAFIYLLGSGKTQ